MHDAAVAAQGAVSAAVVTSEVLGEWRQSDGQPVVERPELFELLGVDERAESFEQVVVWSVLITKRTLHVEWIAFVRFVLDHDKPSDGPWKP